MENETEMEVQCKLCYKHYTNVQEDYFVVTECQHIFHNSCLQEYLQDEKPWGVPSFETKPPRCPNCKNRLYPDSYGELKGTKARMFPKEVTITILGDLGVGKTGLVNCFATGSYTGMEMTTIGVDFKTVCFDHHKDLVKVYIHDTGGDYRFRAITPQYVRNCHGVIIAYDCQRVETLRNCKMWLDFANQHAPTAEKIVIGCRADLEECTCYHIHLRGPCPKPSSQEVEKVLAEMGNLWHITTSARTTHHVEHAFRTLAARILKNNVLSRDPRVSGVKDPSTLRLTDPPPCGGEREEGVGCCSGLRKMFSRRKD